MQMLCQNACALLLPRRASPSGAAVALYELVGQREALVGRIEVMCLTQRGEWRQRQRQ